MSNELDALLDSTLDDLADLPEFKPFPPGVHKVSASFESKPDIGGKAAVELSFKYLEVQELANSQDVEPKEEDTANMLFFIGNPFGLGALKKAAIPFGEMLGTGSLRDIIEQTKDVECLIITGLKKDKNDPDKFHMQLKEIAIV